jgi:hypothetical protein
MIRETLLVCTLTIPVFVTTAVAQESSTRGVPRFGFRPTVLPFMLWHQAFSCVRSVAAHQPARRFAVFGNRPCECAPRRPCRQT